MSPKSPIKCGKTFCILPWVHMHLLPSAAVLPCCVWPYKKPIGDASKKSLKEIWNSEEYRKLRLNMLNEIPSEGCKHCYEVDGAGGVSMRALNNHRFSHLYDETVTQTESDGSVAKVHMAYFDVRFSNICNFKCRGCSPELSSAWSNDWQKLFDLDKNQSKLINISSAPHIWQELVGFIDTVETAYFAGGEPLLMEEHYRVLDELIAREKFKVHLSYNTNLSEIRFKGKNICDYWEKFPDMYVGVSIDDIGARGEYFRHGMRWEKLLENFQYIKQRCPHIYFGVNCTVSVMNVLYLVEVHQELMRQNLIRPEAFYLNFLAEPSELNIQILPTDLKNIASKKIRNYMSEYQSCGWKPQVVSDLDKSFESVINFINQNDQTFLIPKFQNRTKKLDMIRGESYESTFPELAEHLPLA